jgi:TolB-like protein/DNA-binding winged helix-turn-helix (wHTH) protein
MFHESSRLAARFEGWSLLRDPLELWHDGQRVHAQEQPLQILEALVARPGELVKRDVLIAKLWPRGITDFDAGLNTAMRKLRAVLDDDADTPRFIETVPRQGYRFVGQLAADMTAAARVSETVPAPPQRRQNRGWFAALLLGSILIGAAYFFWRTSSPTPDSPRIAVLPFENLSPDPANAFFADAMHDEILRSLATAPNLDVVSRTTMMLYRKSPATVPRIVEDLGASHVLEGTVRRDAEEVRVTLRLIDASLDTPVWSRSFDRKLVDVMTLQSEIASEVARELATRLRNDGTQLPPSKNAEAYDLWLKGALAWQNVGAGGTTMQEMQRVQAMYSRAIELDPSYAAAYADRCRVRIALFNIGYDTSDENLASARADLAMAQKLAPRSTHVMIRSANVAYLIDGDLDRALALIAAAEKAGPLDADHLMTKANFLGFARRLDEALATHAQASKLDPGNPTIARFQMVHLFAAHRPADALRVLHAIDERMPGRIERGELSFDYTASTARWRAELERMREMPQPNFSLSNEFDLLRFEGRSGDLAALLESTPLTEFRQHSASRTLIGAPMKPVAALRGWERLMAGDQAAAAAQGALVLKAVERQTKKPWNTWALHLLAAEGALLAGDRNTALDETRLALAAVGNTSNLAVTLHTQRTAARIYAWAGAHEQAMELLEALSSSYPGVGPAAIVRDPLFSVPLAQNARWKALASTLEAQIAMNQAL